MSFTLHVDVGRWRAHQRSVVAAMPGIVPVIKGNGYGVGTPRLAAEATLLGTTTVAVGTAQELASVREGFPGDLLVLTPWHPLTGEPAERAAGDQRAIRTVAHLEALRGLGAVGGRIVIECRTSLHRHGISEGELDALPPLLESLDTARVEGFALHLPLDRPDGVDPVAEASAWLARLREAHVEVGTLWVSHLTVAEVATLRERHPEVSFRPRVGTLLWVGERTAIRAAGTVLDVQPVTKGQRCGYRQRRTPTAGHIVVVAGGTAQGVALEAPRPVRGVLTRAKVLAHAGLAASNRVLSPFSYRGKQRWFLEPPHMQVSLLLLGEGLTPPAIGDELDCVVRLTTIHPDRVVDE
jgi:alanine racemase